MKEALGGMEISVDNSYKCTYLQTRKEGRKEMFYLTTHSTHFIYGYMTSDIWLRTILIVRKETRCCHIGYSFQLASRVLLYAPSHRQDSTYHGLCYISRGTLVGTNKEDYFTKNMCYMINCLIKVDIVN